MNLNTIQKGIGVIVGNARAKVGIQHYENMPKVPIKDNKEEAMKPEAKDTPGEETVIPALVSV